MGFTMGFNGGVKKNARGYNNNTRNVLCKHKWRASLLSIQLIGYHFRTIIDKYAHTFPEYQVLVHISIHKCIPI